MSDMEVRAPNAPETWKSFYQSSPRQLITLSRYLQAQSMGLLKQTYGHRELRLYFEPYIYLLGVGGRRITELAELLSISKQACNQAADKLEELDYVERRPDEKDGRAKLLFLTDRGRKLIEDGVRTALTLDELCKKEIGEAALLALQKYLRRLCNDAGLLRQKIPIPKTVLQTTEALLMLLPRLGDDAHQKFLQRVINQNYPHLKPSHLECFTLIGGCQGKIKRMAQLQGVSVAAVVQLARELEGWGYLTLSGNQQMTLTPTGWALLVDAQAADQQLEARWVGCLGQKDFAIFKQWLTALYEALELSKKMLGRQNRVQDLAANLRRELPQDELYQLGRLLLEPAGTEA